MKKILTTTFLTVLACFMLQAAVFGQARDTRLGIGVAYDGKVEGAGLQVNALFPVSAEFDIAPDITFYFPDNFDHYVAFNIDGHYLLTAEPEYLVYALGGLNLTTFQYKHVDNSDSKLGINVGIGGEYHLEGFSVF